MVSWGLVALVVFPLLQVPAVLLVGRYCKLGDDEDPGRPPVRDFWTNSGAYADSGGTPPGRADDPTAVDPAPDAVPCPECGAPNESDFRYCGACAATLYAAD